MTKVFKADKPRKCFACGVVFPKGTVFIDYEGKADICMECAVLMTKKTGPRATNLREGEFSTQNIPNCLRKHQKEFRKNPKKVVQAIETKKEPVRCRKRISVNRHIYSRSIFHFPEGPYLVEQFVKGSRLEISSPDKHKTVIIKGVWSTSGELFGASTRQVAILVERI